jgi:hypothetical protein
LVYPIERYQLLPAKNVLGEASGNILSDGCNLSAVLNVGIFDCRNFRGIFASRIARGMVPCTKKIFYSRCAGRIDIQPCAVGIGRYCWKGQRPAQTVTRES